MASFASVVHLKDRYSEGGVFTSITSSQCFEMIIDLLDLKLVSVPLIVTISCHMTGMKAVFGMMDAMWSKFSGLIEK